jgi:hypothetical protein
MDVKTSTLENGGESEETLLYLLLQMISPTTSLSTVLKLWTTLYKSMVSPVILYECENWRFILREENRLRMFEDKVPRRIFGSMNHVATGNWRKLYEKLPNLCSWSNTVRTIESRRIRWMQHVA